MSEPIERPDSTTDNKNKWQPLWEWWNVSGIKTLLAVATILLIGIGLLAGIANDNSQRMNILAVGILGIITLVVTVINAISTARMVDIMQNQETEITEQRKIMSATLEQTRDLFIVDLQPAIVVNNIVLRKPISSGEFPVVFLTATNTGRSAANDVQVSLAYGFLDEKMQKNAQKGIFRETFDTLIEDDGQGVIGSQQPFGFNTQRFNLTYGSILDGVRAYVLGGLSQYYVWGEITYSDQWGNEYATRYCVRCLDLDEKALGFTGSHNAIIKTKDISQQKSD